MGRIGRSSCTACSLVLLLLQTLWLHTSAELTFLGQEPFRVFASQGSQTGDVLYQIFVVDSQNEVQLDVTFSIVQPPAMFPFILAPSNGQLLVTGILLEEQYSFTVAAMSGSISITTNITVTIIPLSDMAPRFEHAQSSFEVSEALTIGSVLGVVRAFSLIPETISQRYSIVAGNTDGDISINSDTGLLRADRNLDRERTSLYQLTIRYVDDEASVDATVTLSVTDINDQSPQFSNPLYDITVPETVSIGTPILTINATDSDLGVNAVVTYSLQSTVSSVFSLNAENGVLSTAAQLDYERMPRYQFRVTATDGGDPPLSSVATVLLTLLNVDDECPRFENPVFIAELSYDVSGTPPSIGTEILTVVATDPDRVSQVTYSIVSGETEVLALDSRTGTFTLANTDSDPRGQYSLNVSASDASCVNRSFARVEIGIGNVNDHSPQFDTECVASLQENPSMGTEIVTLHASDLDIGFNGLVTYSVLSGTSLFAIDPTSGVVSTTASPSSYDRETQSTYQVGVTASDGGGRQDYCLLTITLQDENDNHPRIPLPAYSTSLSRSSSRGTFVLQVTADDPDVGSNGHIVYSINHTSSLPFQISNLTGVITTSDTLPSETNDFEFTVVASDLGTPQLTSSTVVTITLTDSDSLPRFNKQNYTASVCENVQVSTTVLTVSISNVSPSDFVIFNIQAGTDYRSNSDGTFEITRNLTMSNLAHITVGSQSIVNFESLYPNPSFQFIVSASNLDGSSIVPVEIFVIDIDDNPPDFSTTFFFTIAENEPVGTTVGRVQATDRDSGTNGEISYRFRAGSNQLYFNITSDGTIISNRVFDFETSNVTQGNLIVEAFNPNPEVSNAQCPSLQQRTDFGIIQWRILDQNDNPPSFSELIYTINVPENTPIQTRLFILTATDQDVSDLGRLSFSIISGNDGSFEIDSNFIILTRRLDFEAVSLYDLDVQVTDGITSTSDCAQCVTMVRIIVTDVDDEAPEFLSSSYRVSVTENAPIGTSVLTISATDVDSPSIQYQLAGLAEGRFSINQTGVIFVSGSIDREEFPGGSLVFLAFAEGGSLGTASILIDIDDVNDYVPRFSSVSRRTIMEKESPGETGIYAGEVQAVDLDREENGTVVYSLVMGGESGFRIDRDTGVITAHAQFDREAISMYELIIEARDNGSKIQLSSETQVIIEIGDVNDNPASFPFSYMFTRLFENPPLGHSVFFLPAVDPDTASGSARQFTLIGSNPPEPKFALNSTTGEVTVTGSLDYEIPLHRRYTLTVSVVDPDTPPVSMGTLEIQLIDRNDNSPTVSVSQPESNLQETRPLGQVATVTASDLDSGTNSELMFAITEGNVNGDFELNATGVISLVHKLDYETIPLYILTVTVSDKGNPPLSTSVEIEFNVIDVNDESPIFTQSVYRVSIQEGSPPSSNLTQVFATDRDTGNGGVVNRYEILGGNEGAWFNLSSDGILGSRVVFDRENRSEYTLTVVAYDRGANSLRGSAKILVTITDINDNPSVSGGHLTVLILALNGTVSPGFVASLYFSDPDSDDVFQSCTVLSQDQAQTFDVISTDCSIHLLTANPEERVYNYVQVTGRDGKHPSVLASATIRVQYIDSSQIPVNNLVTVTMNTTSETYINEKLISFPSQVATVLGIPEENLQVVSVQQGNLLPQSTVDISFVAKTGGGVFLPSAAILHQLYLNRESFNLDGHALLNLPLDLCASEPCQNQAGCRTLQRVLPTERVIGTKQFVLFAPKVEFSYECLCPSGTAGKNCEINFDDCYSNPCRHGATCTDLVGGFHCECPEGYSGVDCGSPPAVCPVNTCQNGATCTLLNDEIACQCPPGYYGPLCQYHYFNPSPFCSPDANPCQNSAECSPGRDSLTCVCQPGFFGEHCEKETQLQGGCLGNPCYNGSTCEVRDTGPFCTCSVGFTGPECRWPLNSCELEPCVNGGTCTPGLYNSHVCTCPLGFTGEDCSLRSSPCLPDPCINGRCTDQTDEMYSCECLSGYYGNNCEFTVDPEDRCENEDCSDNGNCTSGRDAFTCTCEFDSSGNDCSVDDDSEDMPCIRNPCRNGGTCIAEASSPDGFRCECSPGFTGPGCESDINECAVDPCMNRGTCVDGINGYTCACPLGLAGYNCQIYCPEGLSGDFCQTLLDPCTERPCQNGGTCVSERGTFTCSCSPTHTGNRCESSLDCSQTSCRNGGTCIDSLQRGGVECECGPGFTGDRCELLTVSFSGSQTVSSYRAFSSLQIRGHGRIEFEFATVDRNGLLLYNTQLQSGRSEDHIAVEVVGGALHVSVSHGNGDGSVSIMNSPVGVSDGLWHRVVIKTTGKEFSVSLDECLLIPDNLLPFATGCISMETAPGASQFLDLGLPLWVGGAPTNFTHVSSQGFTGCIRNLRIDGEILDFEGYTFQRNSQRGCSRLESQVCLRNASACGGGTCVPVFDGYSCDCPSGREGVACETDTQKIMFGGGTFAEYFLLDYQPAPVITKRQTAVSPRSTMSDSIHVRFRTEMTSGVGLLLYMGSEERNDELYLQLEDGYLHLYINLGSMEERIPLMVGVADSLWHTLEVIRLALDLTVWIDGNVTVQRTLQGTQLSLDVDPIIYVGGRPNSGGSDILTPYLGCLEDIRIDNIRLPTSGANDFASVEFTGDTGTLYNCALGVCLRQPCGPGNCTERGTDGYQCVCELGETTISRPCPTEPSTPMYTLPIVFGSIAGSLLLIVILTLICMFCYRCLRNRSHKLKLTTAHPHENGVDLFGRQCLVISNESGGGEMDTHIGVDEISSALFTNCRAIQKEEEEEREKEDEEKQSEGFSVQSPPKITRADTPTIEKYIQQKIECIPRDYRDIDSMHAFEVGGNGSETGSLSSICSSSAESVYTVEKLRWAGPEFELFADLLASVLESEDEDVEGDSQRAHTGNTQQTQGLSPLSQDLW